MTLQQWLFSIKGRIGRRDFWIWIAIWLVTMSALFTLARQQSAQPADGGVYYRLPGCGRRRRWWSSGCTIAANPGCGRC